MNLQDIRPKDRLNGIIPNEIVHIISIKPLPHQIMAVYGEMLPRQPLLSALTDELLGKNQHILKQGTLFIRQFWFNTPPNLWFALAAAQTMQRLQKFGIKPDHIINFLYGRTSVEINVLLKIPRSSAAQRFIDDTGPGFAETNRSLDLKKPRNAARVVLEKKIGVR
jgi:hypothetical protein